MKVDFADLVNDILVVERDKPSDKKVEFKIIETIYFFLILGNVQIFTSVSI